MLTVTELRQDIYKILDQVVRTGEPVDIVRKGQRLRIVLVAETQLDRLGILTSLAKPDLIVGDPEDLVHMDWSEDWHSDLP